MMPYWSYGAFNLVENRQIYNNSKCWYVGLWGNDKFVSRYFLKHVAINVVPRRQLYVSLAGEFGGSMILTGDPYLYKLLTQSPIL